MTATLTALMSYVGAVLTDGDWRNDWLTHLPDVGLMRLVVAVMGRLLACISGRA